MVGGQFTPSAPVNRIHPPRFFFELFGTLELKNKIRFTFRWERQKIYFFRSKNKYLATNN